LPASTSPQPACENVGTKCRAGDVGACRATNALEVARHLNIVIIELIVVLGVALGIGFWQLYDVNRELRKDREKQQRPDTDDRE